MELTNFNEIDLNIKSCTQSIKELKDLLYDLEEQRDNAFYSQSYQAELMERIFTVETMINEMVNIGTKFKEQKEDFNMYLLAQIV